MATISKLKNILEDEIVVTWKDPEELREIPSGLTT